MVATRSLELLECAHLPTRKHVEAITIALELGAITIAQVRKASYDGSHAHNLAMEPAVLGWENVCSHGNSVF